MVTITGGAPAPRAGASGDPEAESPGGWLGGRTARWVSPLIAVALLAAALFAAAKGLWVVWGPPVTAVNAVSIRALGGDPDAGSVPTTISGRSTDRTVSIGSRLALVGVILPGHALISIEGRPQRAFAVGQEIVAGLILRAIYRDRVLVERAGAQEVLVLRDATGGASPLLAAGAQPGGRMVPVAPPSAYPEVRQIGKNQYLVARDQVNAQMRDPEFLTDARLDPHPGGGFVVNGIRPDSVYEKLGLQAGDVIRTVNGAPVNSVADAVGFYQQLYQTNQVRLGVVRGGKVVQLSYNLQ